MSAMCGEDNHFTIDGSAAAESGRPEVVVSGLKVIEKHFLKQISQPRSELNDNVLQSYL